MTTTVWIIFIAIISIILIRKINSNHPKVKLKQMTIPTSLGYRQQELVPIIIKLEHSLSEEYIRKIKERVLQTHSHWTEEDFEWRLFELKRYFVLAKILPSVPMFSEEVDEIWHEMLMFTKEYEAFCTHFYGEFLHHTPNTEGTPLPNERAFFDWVYIQLFEITPNSQLLWGQFLSCPLHHKLLDNFQTLSDDHLLSNYFRKDQEALMLQQDLLKQMREAIEQTKMIDQENRSLFVQKHDDTQLYLLTAMVFFSQYDPEHFKEEMGQFIQKDGSNQNSTSSSCSSYSCDNHHDSSCSSSNCSSSSCGSS